MAGAIRSRTVQKGIDPREFALVAFGGGGPPHAAEVAPSRSSIPEVIVPPYPGITSAMGLLTSDLRYDQMRTVFMLEGAIDAERLDRELGAGGRRAARAAARGRRRRRRDRDRAPRLDCRYVGQGYELRIPLPEGASPRHALSRRSIACTSRNTATRSAIPIEIVNLRVTAVGKRPRVERLPAPPAAATRCSARASASSGWTAASSHPTRYYERSLLPVGERFAGPAVVLPARHDDGRPARLDGSRADASGSLILGR